MSSPAENWPVVTLAEAVTVAEGQVDPRLEPYSSMIHVGPEDVDSASGRLLGGETAKALGLISGKYRFRSGDIVYSKIRPYLRKVWLATFTGICSADMYPLTVREGFDRDFVAKYLLSREFTDQTIRQQARTGIPKLNREQLKVCTIPQPPLAEQRAVAAILSKIQKALDVQTGIVATLKELKAATLAKVFREGLRGEALKRTEIGVVPQSWGVEPLEKLLAEPLRNGHSAVASDSSDAVPTLTLTAVTRRRFTRDNVKMTAADPTSVADLWLRDGDIFVERANTREMVGLAALYRGPDDFAIFPDLLIRVRVDDRQIIPEVLLEWLLSPGTRQYYQSRCRGAATSMLKIDQQVVAETLIAVPSVSEQDEIKGIISLLDQSLEVAETRLRVLTELFDATLEALMTGRIDIPRVAPPGNLHPYHE